MATTLTREPSSSRRHPGASQPAFSGKLVTLLLVLFVAGALSTFLWIGAAQFPGFAEKLFAWPIVLSLIGCVVLTSANLVVRWFRWHFLIRRFSYHVITRDSLAVYMATLPAIVTPFFLGELVRVLILRKRFRKPASYLIRIWLGERILDGGVLLVLLAASFAGWLGAASALILAATAVLVFKVVLGDRLGRRVLFTTATALVTTFVAWSFPVIALYGTLRLLAHPGTLETAVRTFAAGTLVGGVTGLPLGVFVTGSTMITELTSLGVPQDTGVLAILVYRAGTAWFAVVLGLAALVLFRRRLAALVRGQVEEHFDELAPDYEGEIPAHVRDRLLKKKVGYIERELHARGIAAGARGLDLGCGQGWYLAEFVRLGYRLHGADYSQGQLTLAEQHLARANLIAEGLTRADAQALPFPDASFDFVYSINAFHHILAPGAQRRALEEVVRVLRPGGVFVLHEINTHNPLFRLYMSYVFPLLKRIDEGNEEWLLPGALPQVPGARWCPEMQYFTFLPDFVPSAIQRLLSGVERKLERSSLRQFSAHYQATLVKDA